MLTYLRRLWSAATRTTRRRVASGLVLAVLVAGSLLVVTGGDEGPSATATGPGPTTAVATNEVGVTGGRATTTRRGRTAAANSKATTTTTTTTTAAPAPGASLGPTAPPSGAGPPTAPPSAAGPPTTLPPTPPAGSLRFLPEDAPDNGSRAPLTGLPVVDPSLLGRAALAIKIDNLDIAGETARPQTGLAFADVVVEEVVEGGITRFVAILHSTDSPEAGPVRSARTTDVHLLPILGRPLFAYSGGNPGVLDAVRRSPSIVDRGGEWAPAYARVQGRRPPHNLYVRPWEIWARGEGSTTPPPLGPFRPRGEGSPIGEPVRGVNVAFDGIAAAGVSWSWLPEDRRWLRQQGGSTHVDGAGWTVGPRNVVVMFTQYVASPADPRSPEGITVGSGEAWVFTDGKLVMASWSRPSEAAPLTFLDGAGVPIPLSAGRTWIELVRPGTAGLVR